MSHAKALIDEMLELQVEAAQEGACLPIHPPKP
jgi:hypothetical protein